jgi:BirA family biotin operon repressor/biotin-[acetyl-CoA-carboxylase] ligase
LKTIDSTHRLAIDLAEKGKAFGCILVAENQTAAVGRCGRKWISGEGNLSASFLKAVPRPMDLGQTSLAAGVAVHEAILSHLPADDGLRLHWPNDVLHKGRKISGLLLAVVNEWLIISVGVNVNSSPDRHSTVSLAEVLTSPTAETTVPSAEDLVLQIDSSLGRWFGLTASGDFVAVKEYWLRYVNEINSKIIIRNGNDVLSGTFVGLDDFGRLILENEGRKLFISSGDVFLDMEGIVVNHE